MSMLFTSNEDQHTEAAVSHPTPPAAGLLCSIISKVTSRKVHFSQTAAGMQLTVFFIIIIYLFYLLHLELSILIMLQIRVSKQSSYLVTICSLGIQKSHVKPYVLLLLHIESAPAAHQ